MPERDFQRRFEICIGYKWLCFCVCLFNSHVRIRTERAIRKPITIADAKYFCGFLTTLVVNRLAVKDVSHKVDIVFHSYRYFRHLRTFKIQRTSHGSRNRAYSYGKYGTIWSRVVVTEQLFVLVKDKLLNLN